MKLQCPKCNQSEKYGGYPSEPILSAVLCLACGYAGPGATYKHQHPAGERCGKNVTLDLVSVQRKKEA